MYPLHSKMKNSDVKSVSTPSAPPPPPKKRCKNKKTLPSLCLANLSPHPSYFIMEKDSTRSIANPEQEFHYFISKNERVLEVQRETMSCLSTLLLSRLSLTSPPRRLPGDPSRHSLNPPHSLSRTPKHNPAPSLRLPHRSACTHIHLPQSLHRFSSNRLIRRRSARPRRLRPPNH